MTNASRFARKVVALALLLATPVVAGCGARASESSPPTTDKPAELSFVDDDPNDRFPDATRISADETALPAFKFTTTELETGAEVSGNFLFEQSPMIMTFVTPTCVVCVAESHELIVAADANPDITYVMVHTGVDQASYLDFVDNAGLRGENIININDTQGDLLTRFRILVEPSSIFIFPSGEIRSATGALDAHGLERAAEMLRDGA